MIREPRKAKDDENLDQFWSNKWQGMARNLSKNGGIPVYLHMAISIGNLTKIAGKLSDRYDNLFYYKFTNGMLMGMFSGDFM